MKLHIFNKNTPKILHILALNEIMLLNASIVYPCKCFNFTRHVQLGTKHGKSNNQLVTHRCLPSKSNHFCVEWSRIVPHTDISTFKNAHYKLATHEEISNSHHIHQISFKGLLYKNVFSRLHAQAF